MGISRTFALGLFAWGLFSAGTALADPIQGTCVLKNPYSIPYVTNVQTDDDNPTIEAACQQVLACMNNVLCLRYGAPDYHFGWVLDSWYEN